MVLITVPREIGVRGTVEVLVTRESDGRIVPVEFCLETISGQGQTLGCVSV